jgi:hypothetical protein
VAVFSVPKFFGLKNMVGGLVLVNGARSAQLREVRNGGSATSKAHRDRGAGEAGSVRNAEAQENVETLYLRRLLNPALLCGETGGLPGSTGEIRAVGHARQQNLDRLVEAAGRTGFPPGWVELLTNCLPFALPVFLEDEMLKQANAGLSEIGVVAGEYQIDIARDMSSPLHEKAVLVPCHHEIPATKLDEMVGLLRSVVGR